MAAGDFRDYRRHCLEYLDTPYQWGGEDPYGADCSGVLRAYFNLEFTAHDFLERLYVHESGTIGAVFLLDETGHAYHIMPELGQGVVLDMTQNRGGILRTWTDGILRYI